MEYHLNILHKFAFYVFFNIITGLKIYYFLFLIAIYIFYILIYYLIIFR